MKEKNAFAVYCLIKDGGNANAVSGTPLRSLLMIATEQGDLPTVKVLLHAGADVLHSEDGRTALTLAQKHEYIGTGKEECFQQLQHVQKYAEVAECLRQAEQRAFKQLVYSRMNRPLNADEWEQYMTWGTEGVERMDTLQ